MSFFSSLKNLSQLNYMGMNKLYKDIVWKMYTTHALWYFFAMLMHHRLGGRLRVRSFFTHHYISLHSHLHANAHLALCNPHHHLIGLSSHSLWWEIWHWNNNEGTHRLHILLQTTLWVSQPFTITTLLYCNAMPFITFELAF